MYRTISDIRINNACGINTNNNNNKYNAFCFFYIIL